MNKNYKKKDKKGYISIILQYRIFVSELSAAVFRIKFEDSTESFI